ncbi:MAG: Riboflavin synthase [Deltaproteobacteria bacterium]|jgi:riboflavin synthase|nr:Riboflavin synthase [Deltaproteobacteria bacterium]
MFTGIVQGIRRISSVTDFEGGRRLRIQLDDLSENLQKGASVAVNGVCLTAVDISESWAEFDVIQETLNRSNLSTLKSGDHVDIERASRFGDEVGGHHLSGHVDCMGIIRKIRSTPNNHDVVFGCDKEWLRYLIPKGWIAIDGASLTVVDIGENWFSVSLIPETLKQTVLGLKTESEKVNLEFDHSVKVIVHTIERILPEIKENALSKLKD